MKLKKVIKIFAKALDLDVKTLELYIANDDFGLELRVYPDNQSSALIEYLDLADLLRRLSK